MKKVFITSFKIYERNDYNINLDLLITVEPV
jgi:hypothetical protein